MVGRRPQHAVSKLACLVLSSARSCRSSICSGRDTAAWLVPWSPRGDTRGPSVVFEAVDMPCPGPFNFLTLLIISMPFVLPPDPSYYVGLSIFVSNVQHTSFDFGLCGRLISVLSAYMAQLTADRSCTHVSSGRWQGCF